MLLQIDKGKLVKYKPLQPQFTPLILLPNQGGSQNRMYCPWFIQGLIHLPSSYC